MNYKREMPGFPFKLPKKGYLFTYEGDRWQERTALRKLQNACDEAGIEKMTLHDLRHCFATYRLAGGDSVQMIMALGGWRTIGILSRYVDLSEDYQSLLDSDRTEGYLPHWKIKD